MTRISTYTGLLGTLLALSTPLAAQEDWRANYTLYGTTGVIDMPSALSASEGELATTAAFFGDTQRVTLTFQLLPRLSGSFRYSLLDTYDRSFDLQYQILDEGQYRPAVAVGLRDFIGTGRYSSEYLVATKTFGSNLRASVGMGWGRLAGVGGFTNPLGALDEGFETRPDDSIATGGTVLANQFFRGDAAVFGGVEWRVNDAWTLLAEYSSDAYQRETDLIGFNRRSPLNFGLRWQPNKDYQLGAYYLYGSEIGVAATIIIDPTSAPAPTGLEGAPLPVARRGAVTQAASWPTEPVQQAGVEVLGQVLATDGFRLLGAEVNGSTLRVRYENTTYRAEAQGIGRVARALTQIAPVNIDTFILEPSQQGIPLSAVTLRRRDLEQLENTPNAAALSYDRAVISDAGAARPALSWADTTPAFQWGISPYMELTLFDGDEPVRGDVGLEASFQYELRPNLILAGSYRERLVGNRDEIGSVSASTLPPVRREGLRYGAENGRGLEDLTLSWYGRPGRQLYSRVTLGYMERAFGGVSAELLWKPVDSPLAIGAEVNHVAQRDFDLGFGFQDYEVTTGHVSAYYAFDRGFTARVDVGRYLAGDWGATFTLDRVFENGWKIGGYFTLTDVDFEDFGEGSFDKGIRVEIPLDWVLGHPTRNSAATTLTSLERDGGARLRVDGRLYDVIEDGHRGMLEDNWGRFWR